MEVPSAGLSRPFGYCPQFQNDKVEFEFREREEVTRTQIRRVLGLRDYWNAHFGQNFVQSHYFLDTPRIALEHVWKEEVVTAYFEIFTWDLPEETEKCYERHRAR